MSTRLSVRLREDEGITLVEIMVSITILMVTLGAFASTIAQSLQVTTQDEQYVRANQFASDVLEATWALEWDLVGFYEGDAGYTSTAIDPDSGTTRQTVSLGGVRPATSPGNQAPLPLEEPPPVDGTSYTVDRQITWIDDPVIPGGQNHKAVVVRLSWDLRGQPFELTSSAVRSPTLAEDGRTLASGATSCGQGELTSFEISPADVVIRPPSDTSPGGTTQAITVTARTCEGAASVLLVTDPADPLANFGMIQVSPGLWSTTFQAGTTQFQPATYTWTARSTGDRVYERQATVTLRQEVLVPFGIVSVSPTPLPICVDNRNNPRTTAATTVVVEVEGGVAQSVRMTWTGGQNTSVNLNPINQQPGFWTGTIPNNARMARGNVTIAVSATQQDSLQPVTFPYATVTQVC